MARCCPRACGRLATAAVFISVGIVQIIVAIILSKSKYAYMLFGPNIWTALSNIAVGVLLGVASTVWKNINKNSSKHANRRKFLAALVGSIFILNSTTAAMLIVGEGNNLLAIHLESGGVYNSNKVLQDEILAYAYATSVCSPIVCVVISIAFLTGLIFRQKSKVIKTLDIKSILNEDNDPLYNWVYSSRLPKPNPEILKAALSSESESSSSDSDSDSSSDLPVPLHIFSRSSFSDIKNSQDGSLKFNSLHYSRNRNRSLDDSVSPDYDKMKHIPRLKCSSLIKSPWRSCHKSVNSCWSVESGRKPMRDMVAYRSNKKPGTPIRIQSSDVLEESSSSPDFQYNVVSSPYPKSKLSFSPRNQGTINPLQIKAISSAGNNSTIHQSSMEDSAEYEDPVFQGQEVSPKAITNSPISHSEICRTSTTDQTKIHQELENLDNSAIHCDSGVTTFNEIYLDETLPNVKNKSSSSSCFVDSGIKEDSFRSGGDLSILVRNSNFRKKLNSKLVPAVGPVVSEGYNFYKTSNRKSTRSGRMKPYSKSKSSYDKYLQTGFSSFKNRGQVDEMDTKKYSKKHNSKVQKSPMTSISETPAEDCSLPSTSANTSGYMSASYGESEDETDLKPISNPVLQRRQPSSSQKLIADEIRERYKKRTERVSFESDNSR